MNASFSLLGVRPPMNEPMVPRMPGPLLEAPYELLPAPSSVDRMDRAVPTCNPAPSRSMMRMPSPGGYRREPSPPMRFLLLTAAFSIHILGFFFAMAFILVLCSLNVCLICFDGSVKFVKLFTP